jgi:hypothetical protein
MLALQEFAGHFALAVHMRCHQCMCPILVMSKPRSYSPMTHLDVYTYLSTCRAAGWGDADSFAVLDRLITVCGTLASARKPEIIL